MPLYCYIVVTGMYEDVEAHILGHTTKYSQDEFDNICIELAEKYGDVEEIEYFSNYDCTDVKEIRYNIQPEMLIQYLINEYGFIQLDLPSSDGRYHKEISRTKVPPERLQKVVVKQINACPMIDDSLICDDAESDFIGGFHPNARCTLVKKEKDQ